MAEAPKREPRCKVCRHRECHRIEIEVISGRSDRSVAAEFGVSRDSVQRHMQLHVTDGRKAEILGGPALVHNLAKRALQEDRSLIDYLSILRSELLHLFLEAKERGLTFDAASIAQRLLNVLEAIGRLNGQLRAAGITINNVNGGISTGPTVVLNSPEVVKLQSVIIRALSPYPAAREAVVGALRDLEPSGALGPVGAFNGHSAPLIEAKAVEASHAA